ncbi:MAG: hypothetical protein S4CHLAM6_15800 [Chlamydiae bacterium]|nr:hypothetical protein [Chlamydiota bacterium]
MKRRSFSLIELIIALPLVALLFTFLLKNFTATLALNKKSKELHQKVLKVHYFQRRMQQFLDRVEKDKLKSNYFGEKKVGFVFDNGMSYTSNAKGKLFASLFLDKSNHILKLNLYSDDKMEKLIRSEDMLTDIEDIKLDYQFESKSKETQKKYHFTKSSDYKKSNPKKWVTLRIEAYPLQKVKNKEKPTKYFFTLKQSKSPNA